MELFSLDSFPAFPSFDISTAEQETVEKGQDEKNGEDKPGQCVSFQTEDDMQQNILNKEESHSKTDSTGADTGQCVTSGTETTEVEHPDAEQHASSETDEASEERRGVKRKRDDDDNNKGINSMRLQDAQGIDGNSLVLTCSFTTTNVQHAKL